MLAMLQEKKVKPRDSPQLRDDSFRNTDLELHRGSNRKRCVSMLRHITLEVILIGIRARGLELGVWDLDVELYACQ
jgi:hypothetical protein